MHKTDNTTSVAHQIGRSERHLRFGHEGAVIWLTGLSASGKSTLAMGLEARLLAEGYACYTLDGDNIRQGLNSNLGFDPADRAENIRRVGEVAALFADAGLICITAFISPYRSDRALARAATRQAGFHEVFVATPLSICEKRDPKGLYKKARAGQLPDFTGVDAPYEAPVRAELTLDTSRLSIEESIALLATYITQQLPLSSAR